ncbi:DNA primase [Candidatus Phycorickettsia trachydisci]|uniref:DNA primase n=1 Tax=Candidatus Phycorickettsia trachydisci TaxID=2115978 RepID=A0A2P1P7T4_9RICK|nr:DUF5710 domain-containing protein [Candidatus Phycorickettsia trachydisci]AVP87316.1 DNA primase [Candidatus Phycorickettsia trachydisci]
MSYYAIDEEAILYLEVPYVAKDFAKKLGAKWDPVKKQWFISCSMDIAAFKQWLVFTKSEHGNMRADYFYLAQVNRNCYKCAQNTLVNAIILPQGFEVVDDSIMEELEKQNIPVEGKLFCRQNYSSIVSYVTYISLEALKEIYKYIDCCFFREEYSMSVDYSYYRSICQHCHSAQGDNYIISEYNSVFHPSNIEDFHKIQFYKIQQKIKIRAGAYSIDYEPLDYMIMQNV